MKRLNGKQVTNNNQLTMTPKFPYTPATMLRDIADVLAEFHNDTYLSQFDFDTVDGIYVYLSAQCVDSGGAIVDYDLYSAVTHLLKGHKAESLCCPRSILFNYLPYAQIDLEQAVKLAKKWGLTTKEDASEITYLFS